MIVLHWLSVFLGVLSPLAVGWSGHGLHSGVVVSTVTSQQKGSCVEFACSPRVCVASLWVLRLPLTVQKQCERAWLHGFESYLSLCGCVMDWQSVQGVPRLLPNDS